MSTGLSAEQISLQESIYETVLRMDMKASWTDRWKYICRTGLAGLAVSEEYGGSGSGAYDTVLALESVARANPDNGLSFALAAHILSCVIPIYLYGSVQQKEKYLPSLISGELIAANAMTESESGSDVFSMQCKAVKENGKYRLNGTKTFISNSEVAGLVLLYAATNTQKGFFGGITAFLAEKDKFLSGKSFSKMGLESCSLGEIQVTDAVLTEEEMLGKEGGGAVIFNHSMEWERICLAAIHLGAMERVLNKTIQFANERKTLGKSIGKLQTIAHAIADMQVLLDVSRSYTYNAARMLDERKDISKEAAITKLFVSNSLKGFMLQAQQIFGGYGYISDYGIEQEVRDALAATIYSGTSEIQKNIIAANLGL